MGETPLEDLLLDRQSEKLLLVPPAGNHGDTFLHAGLRKKLDDLGIRYRRFGDLPGIDADVMDMVGDANPEGMSLGNIKSLGQSTVATALWLRLGVFRDFDTIYIHGGGNFNEIWGSGVGCYRTAVRLFDCDIIVGPQSYQFEESDPTTLFEDVSNDIHLFCRESYSYERMNGTVGHLSNVEVHQSPDTALYFEKEDLVSGDGSEEYTLIAFRDDKESIGPHDPPVADDTTTVEEDISDTRDSFRDFVDAVARAEHVFTDRLHVATLAAVIEKPVTLYTNSYHKNRGVYEYSLSEFDHVDFVAPGVKGDPKAR